MLISAEVERVRDIISNIEMRIGFMMINPMVVWNEPHAFNRRAVAGLADRETERSWLA